MNLPRSLKLRHLETFVEIARHGSVSRAAESLNLTQPAATRTLRELEQICGCDLVERDGRGIRITHRGEVFLRHAAGSLASAQAAVNALAQLGAEDGPAIRVGALPTFSATLMPEAVNRYFESGMRARLKIVSGENHVMLDQLRDSELDFVMGRLPAPENMTGLVFEPLQRDRVVFVVHQSHELADRAPVTPEDIARFPMLLPQEGSIIRPFVDRLFIELGITVPRHVVETVSDSFGRAFLRHYPAIWLISRGVVAGEIESGEFALLAIDTTSTQGSVGIITRAGSDLTSTARFFAEVLRGLTGQRQS